MKAIGQVFADMMLAQVERALRAAGPGEIKRALERAAEYVAASDIAEPVKVAALKLIAELVERPYEAKRILEKLLEGLK